MAYKTFYFACVYLLISNICLAQNSLSAGSAITDPSGNPPATNNPSSSEAIDSNPLELDNAHNSDEPTYIKSNSLVLKQKDQTFEYVGNVEVKQGDLTLLSDKMIGEYDDDNQIIRITALENVHITKGATIKANSEKAIYEKAAETITLTENPELIREKSVLSADTIRLFLKEDRSTAEGQVRVKLVKEGSEEDAASEEGDQALLEDRPLEDQEEDLIDGELVP